MKLRTLLSVSTGSRFRQNFLKVARANMIALALPLMATPFLTRLFSPSDYGVLAVFGASLAFLTAFSTWRFDWVLPNAKSETAAASLMAAGLGILLLTCIFTLAAVLFIDLSIFGAAFEGDINYVILLLPFAVAASGLRQMFSGWFVWKGDLTSVSRATVAQSIANVSASLASGFAGWGASGLVGSLVIATWAGIGTLMRQAGRPLIISLRRISARTLRMSILRHAHNANWSTLVSIVNAISINAPILVLAFFYAPREVGWYALMFRLVAAPTGALVSALGQSFWSQAAEYARARQISELSKLYRRTTMRLGLACIPIVLICLAGPFFVGPLLGPEEWGGAGNVLAALTPMFIGMVLFSSTNHLVVLDQQRIQLVVDITRLALVIGSISLAHHMDLGIVMAVTLASISSLIGYAMLFIIHLRMHQIYERS